MTNMQINIAIAEACGWSEIRRPIEDNYHDLPTDTLGFLMGRVSGLRPGKIHIENSEPLPNYCNDLNAMHEAEKVLVEMGVNKWWTYAGHILRHNPSPFGAETAIHATARQRAEAFLRTIGKWKEAQ